jgi:hypothetical protein
MQELQHALKQPTRRGLWRLNEVGGIGLEPNRMEAGV